MGTHGKLSVLVQSGRHLDFVEKLTTAAIEKGKQVKIHLLGDGVAFVNTQGFARLVHRSQITICSESFNNFFRGNMPPVPKSVKIVQPRQLTEILQWCQRSVVF